MNQRVTMTFTETGVTWSTPEGEQTGRVEITPTKHEGGNSSLMIFGLNNVTSATGFSPDGNSPSCATIYSFKITGGDGTVRRSFIPCRRYADGEAGLWDEVEGKFHGNRDVALTVCCSDILLGGYTSQQPADKALAGEGVMRVAQTFTPMTDTFYPCQLLDGACIDFSARTTELQGQSLKYAEETTTIQIHLGSRHVRNNERLMTWDEIPAVKFGATRASRCSVVVETDGLYIFRGFTVFVR